MKGTIHRPSVQIERIDLVRSSARLILLSCTALLLAGNVAAQAPNQFANRPAAAPRTEIERTAAATGPISNLPAAERVGAGTATKLRTDGSAGEPATSPLQPRFRIEVLPITGGAELITIFGRMDGARRNGLPPPELPLVSVLRDTLADNDPENDRLRYVWMLTYTQPTILKRMASAIPFLYHHLGNKTEASKSAPAPILDLANTSRQTWNHFFWMGLQNVVLDSYGIPLKAASRSYRRNAADYRTAHVTQALSILNNYENLRQRTRDESELLAFRQTSDANRMNSAAGLNDTTTPLLSERAPAFTPGEMLELRARLILSGKTFGGLFGPNKFRETVAKNALATVDTSGHNWEMLRQRAEAEGLYFQPLTMPDGRATHALLWIARSDLAAQSGRLYHKRFLNIANPWSDARLRNWDGYTQTRYFDSENRPSTSGTPSSRPLEMIPLALYGLDHPKVPALLVDFRDHLNPKGREVSRRLLNDLTRNVFSFSGFGSVPWFLGRAAFNFVTGRRGMDLNQPTRLQSYAELKLLLGFNDSLEPELRREIERRLENISVNPLNNDNASEMHLARQQYDALVDFGRRPDGLAARIDRDRRAEMVSLKHGSAARFFFGLGNILSFGRYVHRESETPQLMARMELARRLERHTNFLSEVAKSSPQTDVAWDMSTVKVSLRFLAENGGGANHTAARAASQIFQRTSEVEARRLCLDSLSKINNQTAKSALLRLYRAEPPQSEWRQAIAEHLRMAVAGDKDMKPAEARAVLNQVGQP